uniref:Pre-mRNA processing factor 4 (PRP4)-like domain-containing protein n=1 Tax=Ditylenchus dipsaci TaxID=166011 RepID=A0A915D1W5_9BILA
MKSVGAKADLCTHLPAFGRHPNSIGSPLGIIDITLIYTKKDMDLLKQVIAQKRKQIEDITIDNANDLLNTRAGEDLTSLEVLAGRIASPEVILRLRSRAAPILLFGETDADALRRLRKLEMEQPELKEGWKTTFRQRSLSG